MTVSFIATSSVDHRIPTSSLPESQPIPFQSEKQRRYLWLKHPDIAKRWSAEYGSKPKKVRRKKHAS